MLSGLDKKEAARRNDWKTEIETKREKEKDGEIIERLSLNFSHSNEWILWADDGKEMPKIIIYKDEHYNIE